MTVRTAGAALLGAGLMLGACTTGDDYFAEQCRKAGIAPGSPAFERCLAEVRAQTAAQHRRSQHFGSP